MMIVQEVANETEVSRQEYAALLTGRDRVAGSLQDAGLIGQSHHSDMLTALGALHKAQERIAESWKAGKLESLGKVRAEAFIAVSEMHTEALARIAELEAENARLKVAPPAAPSPPPAPLPFPANALKWSK